MSLSIPISQLNVDPVIQSQDFVALVNSSSLTTYKSNIQSFNNYIAVSGSVISSSFSSASISSSNSLTSSYLMGIATASLFGTSSNAVSSSYTVSSSYSLNSTSASYSNTSSWTVTASYSNTSSWTVTASYSNFSSTSNSSSWASSSISASYANSSSWASSSISASYANSSSYAVTSSFCTNNNNFIKAWANVTWSNGPSSSIAQYQYNISNISFLGMIPSSITGNSGTYGNYWIFGVTFTNPLSNNNYIMIDGGSIRPFEDIERAVVWIDNVFQSPRTTQGFTMSLFTPYEQLVWFNRLSGSANANDHPFVNFLIVGTN